MKDLIFRVREWWVGRRIAALTRRLDAIRDDIADSWHLQHQVGDHATGIAWRCQLEREKHATEARLRALKRRALR